MGCSWALSLRNHLCNDVTYFTWAMLCTNPTVGCGRVAAARRVSWAAGWRHRPFGNDTARSWAEKVGSTVTGPSAKDKCWQHMSSQINSHTCLNLCPSYPDDHSQTHGQGPQESPKWCLSLFLSSAFVYLWLFLSCSFCLPSFSKYLSEPVSWFLTLCVFQSNWTYI